MGINNSASAYCRHCGSEYHLFTIFNRDMGGLVKVWKRRHEFACAKRSPAQRRRWAKKYLNRPEGESALIVHPDHPGLND